MRINYSIIFVSDMQRSVAFYRDVIGMPLKFETPHWTEFATEGATLALHKSEETSAAAEPPESEKPCSEKPGTCRAGFQVPNLDEFHQRMLENNVPCMQEPQETFGVKIAQYLDPDGLTLSVSDAGQR